MRQGYITASLYSGQLVLSFKVDRRAHPDAGQVRTASKVQGIAFFGANKSHSSRLTI
jgi:hypothetical protein